MLTPRETTPTADPLLIPKKTAENKEKERKAKDDEKLTTEKNLSSLFIEVSVEHLSCPISYTLLADPVFTTLGQTYSRKNIEKHFKTCEESKESLKDPMTNVILLHSNLTPNFLARQQVNELIEKYCDKEPELLQECMHLFDCGDYLTLLSKLSPAANQGNPLACILMCISQKEIDPENLDSDYQSIVDQFFSALEFVTDKPNIMYFVALCYKYGIGTEPDEGQYLKKLRSSADKKYTPAIAYLGQELYDKHSTDESLKLLQKAASEHHVVGQLYLGHCYLKGTFVKQDSGEAMKLYRLAAERGSITALLEMGRMYQYGNPPDYKEAARLFELSARQNASAKTHLATLQINGLGTPENRKAAFLTFKHNIKDPATQYYLGICYLEGYGVARDHAEAVRIFNTLDSADAHYALGFCYYHGFGTQKNAHIAAEHFVAACTDRRGQNASAICLYLGLGFPEDKPRAKLLFQSSVKQGYLPAIENLKQLELNSEKPEFLPIATPTFDTIPRQQSLAEPINYDSLTEDSKTKLISDKKREIESSASRNQEDEQLYLKVAQAWLGSPPDYKTAISLLEQAREIHSARAERQLGVIYSYGLGVKSDGDKAANFFSSAAYMGDLLAQAIRHHLGSWTIQDVDLAVKMCKEIEAKGTSKDQIDLGFYCLDGYIFARSYETATDLFGLNRLNVLAQFGLKICEDRALSLLKRIKDSKELTTASTSSSEQVVNTPPVSSSSSSNNVNPNLTFFSPQSPLPAHTPLTTSDPLPSCENSPLSEINRS